MPLKIAYLRAVRVRVRACVCVCETSDIRNNSDFLIKLQ